MTDYPPRTNRHLAYESVFGEYLPDFHEFTREGAVAAEFVRDTLDRLTAEAEGEPWPPEPRGPAPDDETTGSTSGGEP